jgi:hypothetical protein
VRSSSDVPMRMALSGLPRSWETTAIMSSRACTAACASRYSRALSTASADSAEVLGERQLVGP